MSNIKKDLLKPVDLKLARTLVQATELCDELEKWSLENPVKVKSELLEGRLGYQIVVSEFENSAKLDEWGILIGEFMHNLRSSLDNLAFALACLKKNPPTNPNQIFFPIYLDEADFMKRIKNKILQHLPADAVAMIENIQPFQRLKSNSNGEPNTDPLVKLQWYNNVDKHRIPNVLLMLPNGVVGKNVIIEFDPDEDAKLDVPPQTEFFGYPIKEGAILMKHITHRPVWKITGKFTYGAEVSVQGLNGIESVDLLVKQLHDYTALVVNQFRAFFE